MNTSIQAGRGDRIFDAVNISLLTGVLVIVLYPLVFVLSASISDPLLVMQGQVWLWPKGLNLDAYARVFQNSDIMTGYRNVIVYTILGTAINVILTIAAAYPLSRRDFVGRNVMMLFIVATMFFSGGLIPTYLVVKGLALNGTMWALLLPGAVSVFNLIIMRTFFQNTIPTELQESAVMDGASNFRILFTIVLPLSMPVIAVIILYYAVGHWNSYFSALIYLSDRSQYPLQLFLRELLIMNQMQDMMSGDSESAAKQQMLGEALKYAVIIVSSVPVLLLYPFMQRYFVKGVMIGAIKG
jgi:putative aldouronate transport system permease protein